MHVNSVESVPKDMVKYDSTAMGMNVDAEELLQNISKNIERHLPQVKAYPLRDQRIAIIAGGPSLNDTVEELKQQVKEGVKLVAVNNTHDWLLDHGLRPSVQIMVDARRSNVRFVQRPIKTCKYLIASQCSPAVFDALEGYNTWIWHSRNNEGEKEILDNYYMGQYIPIVGGSTVVLRAIWIMRLLGFSKMDVYGFDSCTKGDQHHAYDQPENDGSEIKSVICAGKEFRASSWMMSQADDFMHFVKNLGDNFELSVHGDGLIAHILKEGANYEVQDE